MEEVNATILSYIKKANDAFISGDSVQAYNYVLRAAECTLTQAKSCVGVKREKFLKTYNELKIMLARLPKQEQNNNITASEELKTSGTFTKGTSDETVGGETRTRKPLISDALNPQYLSDYIGQPQAVTAVKDLIDAALLKDTAMPHIILYGSHGLGKTTFARIIANEMRTRFVEINASKITVPEMISVLKKIKPKDIVFIDEIHTLPLIVAESVLYSAMQDGHITYTEGKGKFARAEKVDLPPFTLIGATTEIGKMAKPFTQRAMQVRLVEYTDEVLGGIISRSFYKLGMSISDEDALYISKRCRNNPRIANNTVKRISDKALVRYAQQNNLVNNGAFSTVENIRKLNIRITQNVIDVFFEENGIDEYGLEKGDRDLLRIIITRYGGGPVGIDTLSRVMNESNNVIAQKYESYLVKKGFLKIERDGRVVMPEAYKVLGLPVPIAEKTENTASSTEREEIKSKYDTRKIVAALVQDELKCAKLEELICYPESVKERGETLDELFPDIEKGYEGENETKHLCKNEIDFDTFKRTLICDSFLESRFASCMASVGFLKDIKAQTVELPYISQELNNRRYFPDFVIKDYKSRIAVIEMKNFEMMSYHLNIDKYETLKAYCEKNGYGYAEIMKAYNSDKYVSVEQIKNAPVNEALSKYVYETIEKNGADSGEGIFTDENLAEYKMNNPNTGDTDIYTLLLSDRRLKNVDRTGTNIRIIKN